jgi:hypothetical protein
MERNLGGEIIDRNESTVYQSIQYELHLLSFSSIEMKFNFKKIQET